MLKSLKNRTLLYFLLVAFAIACIVFPLNYFHKQSERSIHNSLFELSDIHTCFIKDLRYTSEFLSFESTNPHFFITSESYYLEKHYALRDSILDLLEIQIASSEVLSSLENKDLMEIRSSYNSYCSILDSMAYLIYKRGYRDLGLEGEMISYIYRAEKQRIYRKEIFEIRMNEREYLNRNDSSYLSTINILSSELIEKASKNQSMEEYGKSKFISFLEQYRASINKLAALDAKLGLRTRSGLREELFAVADKLENDIDLVFEKAHKKESLQIARLNFLFIAISIFLLLSAVIASMFLSRHLLSHLDQLTQYISKLASSDFRHNNQLNLRKSSTEIRKIYTEFRNMVAQLKIREIQRDEAVANATENEMRYRELADLLPQSIFETDRVGNLVYVNKAWYKKFGYSSNDLEDGLNLIEILQTDTENMLSESIHKVENSDYVGNCKNGSKFPAIVYSDTISRDDKFAGRRGIVIDATMRNKYIETLHNEKMRAVTSDKHKSFFLANMSHEIRTPMNSIIGFANLLGAEQIPAEQKLDFIQYIQSSGQILLNLIDDIIDIAKIETGELKLKPMECEPAKILKELQNTFEGYKTTLGKQNIELITEIPENEILCKTDPFRLRQILSNLMSNAIKFTEKGKVKVSLKIKNDRELEFSVEDTGMGLSKEELKQIFTRFQRTTRSEEKGIKGTGLGLTISKNLVELLGGQMWVNSESGKGTIFWFELPYVRVPENRSEPTEIKIISENKFAWSNRTFLIAEDDDQSYIYLHEILEKTGAKLIRAVNGREVVEAVKFTEDIDCVLMDIQMPYLNGYDATREIKKLKPLIPVIAQTAYAMDGDKEKSILAGCDDYITKPINQEKLLAKINQFIHDKEPAVRSSEKDKEENHKSASKFQNRKSD